MEIWTVAAIMLLCVIAALLPLLAREAWIAYQKRKNFQRLQDLLELERRARRGQH
jgi:hypothetical protein